jgi:hypothetical protein
MLVRGELIEIAQLARLVAELIPTDNTLEAQKVSKLFKHFKALAGVCMHGSEVRAELKEMIEASEYAEFDGAVKFFQSASNYSIDMSSDIKQKAIHIATILETTAQIYRPKSGAANITPVTENVWSAIQREYGISKVVFGKRIGFITDVFKRKIIFRDVEQAYSLANSDFNKPAIILSGSIIEELLRLYLEHKRITPPKADFEGYLKACEDNGLIKAAVYGVADPVRRFGHLVHLKNENSTRHTISKTTAQSAVSSIFVLANEFN